VTRVASTSGRPLSGIRVLDFSTLLPGLLATLLLVEAGADVLKVEHAVRPPAPQHRVTGPGYDVSALPVPLAASLRPERSALPYPWLGGGRRQG
jgi:crotonobetainyl-CoA:carnitine CoA-transferase CaiB-like acyl-CoA transferase